MKALFHALVFLLCVVPETQAAPFEDVTAETIGTTAGWTNKVELADLNGDGYIDLLFANGGGYASPGQPELNGAFLNDGTGSFTEVSEDIFKTPDLSRVIKVRDFNNDGVTDLFIGTTYQTQSRLLLGLGAGDFVEVTNTHLPTSQASIGDAAIGDIDGDGDLDMVLADWGPGNPLNNEGGVTRLWLNNGFGAFTDATSEHMPDIAVRFSWELELVDVDNDWDLDIVVSCKSCNGSKLYHNTGDGSFTDASHLLPPASNNYDFEAMDLNQDGFLDLVTINDGPGLRERLLLADGLGGFTDATETLWPEPANIGEDDNMLAFLDYDSDGDADFLIGSLSGEDRLLLNDGSGALSLQTSMFNGAPTPGTLGIALADLNGDNRLDVVHAQGEVATPERVFFGVDIQADTADPVVARQRVTSLDGDALRFEARIHDYKSPVMPHDFQSVIVKWSVNSGDIVFTSMQWVGEMYFATTLTPDTGGVMSWQVCATDRAGNNACGPLTSQTVTGDARVFPPEDISSGSDGSTVGPQDAGNTNEDTRAEPNDADTSGSGGERPTSKDASSSNTGDGAALDALEGIETGLGPVRQTGGCATYRGADTQTPSMPIAILICWLLALGRRRAINQGSSSFLKIKTVEKLAR